MIQMRSAGLFLAGSVIGALVLATVQRFGLPHDPSRVSGRAGGVESVDQQIIALPAESDQRILAQTTENKSLQEQSTVSRGEDADLGKPRGQPRTFEEVLQHARSLARQRDTENLLAAGYTIDRIEYMRRRAEELAVQFRQSNTDRLKAGLPMVDPPKMLGLDFDPDFALRDEIGDAEYERYLTALKRPTAVGIADVVKGSLADSVGIMPGDEIVEYDNTRVYNKGQLDGLSRVKKDTDMPGDGVPVTVRRSGQLLYMNVPRGALGIRPTAPDLGPGNIVVGSPAVRQDR